ncbi:hypothetical protein P4H71_20195 [Paenibacillus kribbensis]|uniref:hypothetical protein n=1 Tax=Paenibacillus kribbensis TaxID=172713 RepID=UPI002DBBAC6B|nr:hypothetical protein [Paenibacillus kribbensis]MEC0236643.1 hypothetical protein [Paenibacillus kribbensis]
MSEHIQKPKRKKRIQVNILIRMVLSFIIAIAINDSKAIKDIKNKSQSERKQHHDEMEEQRRSLQREVRQQVLRLKR